MIPEPLRLAGVERGPDHLTRAREHADSHQRGARRHWTTLGAVETLFGRPIAQVLRDEAENVNENASEAVYYYEEVLKERDREHADLLGAIRLHLTTEAGLRETISLLRADLVARYKRSGKPLPDYLADMEELARHMKTKHPSFAEVDAEDRP